MILPRERETDATTFSPCTVLMRVRALSNDFYRSWKGSNDKLDWQRYDRITLIGECSFALEHVQGKEVRVVCVWATSISMAIYSCVSSVHHTGDHQKLSLCSVLSLAFSGLQLQYPTHGELNEKSVGRAFYGGASFCV